MIDFFIFLKKIIRSIPRICAHPYRAVRLIYIARMPRFRIGMTRVLGNKTWFIDRASFLYMYGEIFEREIYTFSSLKKNPYIIDCGANIGLSVIYFKKLFPKADIIAFEPDQTIIPILEKNIHAHHLRDITVCPVGVAAHAGTVSFASDGADGGRIISTSGNQTITTVRLRDYITKEVDFLKLDIEGSETEVLEDIQDQLSMVRTLFIEYHSFSDTSQTLSTILTLLERAGFRYYIDRVGVMSPHPYKKVHTVSGMDLQLNIFCYRV